MTSIFRLFQLCNEHYFARLLNSFVIDGLLRALVKTIFLDLIFTYKLILATLILIQIISLISVPISLILDLMTSSSYPILLKQSPRVYFFC